MKNFAIVLFLLPAACGPTQEQVKSYQDRPGFIQVKADPGFVNKKCYRKDGTMDSGERQDWKSEYCGCLECYEWTEGFGKCLMGIIWTARRIECDAARNERHEFCHADTGLAPEARRDCDAKFHQ